MNKNHFDKKPAALPFVQDLEPFFYKKHLTYIDVGAYHGEVLKTLANSTIRIRHAHLIEPNPESFSVLKDNLNEPGDAKYLHFHPIALGAGEKKISMWKEGGKTRFFANADHGYFEGRATDIFEASALSLDTFCKQLKLSRVSLLKIDVEGYEEEVLQGAEELLKAQAIDVIYIEAGVNPIDTDLTSSRKIEDVLNACDYSLFKIYEQTHQWIDDSPKLRRVNLAFMSERFLAANPYRIRTELFQREQELAAVTSERDKTKQESAQFAEENKNLRARLSLLKTEANNTRDIHQKELADLITQLQERQDEVARVILERDQAHRKATEAAAESVQCREELATATLQLEEARRRLDTIQGERHDEILLQTEAVAEATAGRDQAIAERKDVEAQVTALQDTIRATQTSNGRELAKVTAELDKLRTQNKKNVRATKTAEAALRKRQDRVKKLEKDLQQIKNSLAWRITLPGRLIWRRFQKPKLKEHSSNSGKVPSRKPKVVHRPSPGQQASAGKHVERSPAKTLSEKAGAFSFAQQVKLVKQSRQLHAAWYRSRYPDVEFLKMDPAVHYLKYGAAMGRNPGKHFDTTYYLETYPDVVKSGLNPLVHYALIGQQEGRERRPKREDPFSGERREIDRIRGKLLTLGFTKQPLADFQQILETSPSPYSRFMAARELALWNMRGKTDRSHQTALHYLAKARENIEDRELRSKLATMELLCHHLLGQETEGRAFYEQAGRNGEVGPDTMLAWVNYQPTPEARCIWINQVLKRFSIPPVALLPDDSSSPYDRLTSATSLPIVRATEGPKVTVLVAAHKAARMISTTLRSLQAQTWQNLEILVIDDCSPDDTCSVVEAFAADDSRIRLIRMEENVGAYVARNRGLDEAQGVYVTLHDADDWSHPLKIETQVRFLEETPSAIGCTSQQARASSDLRFTRWTGDGFFVFTNTSSHMFRRFEVVENFGYWDTVRFSADNELIRRIQLRFGKEAVTHLPTGPLSLMRASESSMIADEVLGINGFLFGARKEYLEAQKAFHESAPSLKYDADISNRPFPVPNILISNRREVVRNSHFPLILASEFRMGGGSVQSCIEEIEVCKRFGLKLGLLEMHRYDLGKGNVLRTRMLEQVRSHIDGDNVQLLTYGEEVSCDLLLIRYPSVLQHPQRYIPKIHAKEIKVIVNQTPMSDYSETGVVRYTLENCAATVRQYFGKEAKWHPIGPLVRDALNTHHAHELSHIDLAEQDWHNIIDINGWSRGKAVRGPADKLRIGRHSRDHFTKWPETKEDILAAYPTTDDLAVHVLGGASVPEEVIGGIPSNWVVHPFGAIDPKDFLADIDVFVYFSHSGLVEAFGRTIIEAMAVGVPVILPEAYRPLFQHAALYATPQTAVGIARDLHQDPIAYQAQVERAKSYIADAFSYEMHIDRLEAAGVKIPGRGAPIGDLPT